MQKTFSELEVEDFFVTFNPKEKAHCTYKKTAKTMAKCVNAMTSKKEVGKGYKFSDTAKVDKISR